ncbi:MAG TPA: putative Ig domain-containing protein [Acetobacteraceae bacterium]|nr:putative Ig domain-containing protein [Acetobacteraceae bacterium]
MSINLKAGSVVADPKKQVSLASLFSITASASNPTYLILTGLDRDEYTVGYNAADMGMLSGNGVTQHFNDFYGDGWSVGVVFTYQPSTGLYYNATYGYFNQLTFTTSSNTNDNVSFSLYTTNNASLANAYVTNPYVLAENPAYFTDAGSVSIVTQPSVAGTTPSQATPNSVCSAAMSFVGDAWNENGCWVLASNISAEAGASLPATTTLVGIPGVANGEWIVAYNGPVSASSNWEQQLTAGEMVVFETTSGGGHITTVVSGSGTSAMLVDNIVYVNASGAIVNPANDGSSSDIIVSAPHAATQEFTGVDPRAVVVYELDTPVVHNTVASVRIGEDVSQSLASLFTATNPVASQPVTEWQIYNTNISDAIAVGGNVNAAAHTAGGAVTVGSLANVALLTGSTAGTDTLEARAYNGSYWGDWQSLTADIFAVTPKPPTVTAQTAAQTWQQGQRISFAMASNTFTDPQGETLRYAATQSNGHALPSWLTFNPATETFSGTAPSAAQSVSIKVTATDTSGLSASESFTANVVAAPRVSARPGTVPKIAVTAPIANQTWTAGSEESFVVPPHVFSDALGLKMTFAAYQVSGPDATSWLHFNPAADELFGNVPATAHGVIGLEIVATDARHAVAVDPFAVTIAGGAMHMHTTAGETHGHVPSDFLALLHV